MLAATKARQIGIEAQRHSKTLSTSRWCANTRDRISASLINARMPELYAGALSGDIGKPFGFVYATHLNKVHCSYADDKGTIRLDNHGCFKEFCTAERSWECTYPPERLEEMMVLQEGGTGKFKYNEALSSLRN